MATALRWVAIAASVGVLVGSLRSALRLRVGPTEERIFRLVNDASDAFHAPLWVVMQAGSLGAVWLTGGALWLGDDHAAAAMSVVGGTAIWASASRRSSGRRSPSAPWWGRRCSRRR